MKFTVAFVALLSISTSWAVLAKKIDEPKDKREAPSSYPQSSSGQSSVSYQAPGSSLAHGDASSISVGAGYSIGGAKPSYNFGGHSSGAGLQYSGDGLSGAQGGAYQLAPITLQPGQDLSQIMSQIQQSLGSGALTLQPSNSVAEFHVGGQGGQAFAFPQFQQYAAPQYQQYQSGGQVASAPSYSAGTKGLSSYQTGPVLFNPSQEHGGSTQQAAFSYPLSSAGHASSNAGSLSLGSAGQSFPGFSLGAGHSLGSAGLSLPGSGYSLPGLGHSLGGSGLSFEGAGYNLGGAGHSSGGSASLSGLEGSLEGHSQGGSAAQSYGGSGSHSLGGSGGHSFSGPVSSYGGSGHSFGGSGSLSGGHYKVLGSAKPSPGKSSFKPSTYLGSSTPSESSFHSGSSFPGFSGGHSSLSFGGHGHSFPSFPGFGSGSKISSLYTKGEGSLDSAGAYSTAGHFASPPGTTYGFPSSSYSSGPSHAASSIGPQYYTSPSKYSSSFGEGSSSYKSPGSSYSSLSSHGPQYSFGGHSSRYSSPKDSHGAYSEPVYNTIKYSEELKPRIH